MVVIHRHKQRNNIPRTIGVGHDDPWLGEGTGGRVQRSGDGDLVGIGIHLDIPTRVHIFLIQLDLGIKSAILTLLHQVRNLVPGLLERDYLSFLGGLVVLHAGNNCLLVGVILRVVELCVIEAPLVVGDNVRLAIARQ